MQLSFRRTDSSDKDFAGLVVQLDQDLLERYQEKQSFFDQFNSVSMIKNVIVAYDGEGNALGCGAFKAWREGACEIKRMYVVPSFRGKKIGMKILSQLEQWAKEEGFQRCVLETGLYQPEAIKVYADSGYHRIPNYDQYADSELSLCMEKSL